MLDTMEHDKIDGLQSDQLAARLHIFSIFSLETAVASKSMGFHDLCESLEGKHQVKHVLAQRLVDKETNRDSVKQRKERK